MLSIYDAGDFSDLETVQIVHFGSGGGLTREGAVCLSDTLCILYRRSPLGPVNPSFRALSGRLKFTVRRHKFNKDSIICLAVFGAHEADRVASDLVAAGRDDGLRQDR